MPEQDYWERLLDVPAILDALAIDRSLQDVVEVGCGYGTFTLPVAQRIAGVLYTFDIEPAMVAMTRARLASARIENVDVRLRDIVTDGFALESSSVDAVLLFNILHTDNPVQMLRSAAELLKPGGRLLVIHWRSDVKTPRGPDLSIRPQPTQIAAWAGEIGELRQERPSQIIAPWHYALSFRRETSRGTRE